MTMRALLWKEWHEQAWKLGFGCIVLGTLALLGLHARLLSDEMVSMWVCFIGLTLLPILSSTGFLPAERAEGTLEMLLSLPVRRWRILAVKTVIGVLLCVVPLAAAAALSVVVARGRELPVYFMVLFYARSALTAVALFVWMLAVTARLPSEARGALLAVGILILWGLATAGLDADPMPRWATTLSPLAFIYGISDGFEHSPALLTVIGLQLIIAIALWLCTLSQLKPGKGAE
jgi:ABC-type transport system involved in cytochrome c biogenesis permease component